MTIHDLTAFQRDLLVVISGLDGPNGLEIRDELMDYYGEKVHPGRLYPNLDTLVEEGLIEKGAADRRTNWYGLTRRGRRVIKARREWETEYYDHVHDLETGLEVAD